MGQPTQGSERENDRRRSSRVSVEIECQCVDEGFALLGERIVEISIGGALLRAEGEPAAVGDLVTITFRAPGSSQWIDAEARIARLLTGTHPGAPGFGLELVDLGPFERELLAAMLERHRARAPRRAPARPPPPRARGRVDQRPIVRVEPREPIANPVARLSIVALE